MLALPLSRQVAYVMNSVAHIAFTFLKNSMEQLVTSLPSFRHFLWRQYWIHIINGQQIWSAPRILGFISAEHELVVLHLTDLAEVHGPGPEAGGAEGDLLYRELGLSGQPDVLGQHYPGYNSL